MLNHPNQIRVHKFMLLINFLYFILIGGCVEAVNYSISKSYLFNKPDNPTTENLAFTILLFSGSIE